VPSCSSSQRATSQVEIFPSGQRASGLTLPVVMILALVSSFMTRYPPVGERFFSSQISSFGAARYRENAPPDSCENHCS